MLLLFRPTQSSIRWCNTLTTRPSIPTFTRLWLQVCLIPSLFGSGDNLADRPSPLAGHSAGAQTVQRYAAVGATSQQLNIQTPVTYWVANPDSYVWFSADRPLDYSNCATYDYWKEGLSNYTNSYAASLVASGRQAVLSNYQSKSVMYARGLQDLGDDSSTCAPYSQGSNRNERFYNFIERFPVSAPSTIDYVNAGHDAGAMMVSAAGQARLFFDNFSGNGSHAYDFGCPRQQQGDDPFPDPTCNATLGPEDVGTFNGMTYQGCYTDQGSSRSLPYTAFGSGNNSAALCTAACANAGYTVAGMEYGDGESYEP